MLAQIEKAKQALATIKPVLDLVRSAVSDQDPRAQGKIVGWAAYQAVESALTAGAAELAKSETLARYIAGSLPRPLFERTRL